MGIEDKQLERMKAPIQKPVIQIEITNKCDLRCSNCTRNLYYHPGYWEMSLEQFETAVDSLRDYTGIIGVFGGNPCLHSQFEEISKRFEIGVPEKARRGLWSNNLHGHGKTVERVYGYKNLNVHTDADAAAEMKQHIPGRIWGERESWHSPILVAIQDVVPDEAKMWEQIAACDINQKWSGCITVVKGQLRAYVCEVMAGFDLMYGTDHGLPVTDNWWYLPLDKYRQQIDHFCPGCGAALRLKGHTDVEKCDDISPTHQPLVQLRIGNRKRQTVLHTSLDQTTVKEMTDYQRIRTKGE